MNCFGKAIYSLFCSKTPPFRVLANVQFVHYVGFSDKTRNDTNRMYTHTYRGGSRISGTGVHNLWKRTHTRSSGVWKLKLKIQVLNKYAFSWHLGIRFHVFSIFWEIFLSDTERGAFLDVFSNRGTNIENCTLLQKGHFRPEGGAHPLHPPGSAHDINCWWFIKHVPNI
jgi:hypothetical protein